MAYKPEERLERMRELMKPLEAQIMMCDDPQDLVALASVMLVTARNILVQNVSENAARRVFERVMKEI